MNQKDIEMSSYGKNQNKTSLLDEITRVQEQLSEPSQRQPSNIVWYLIVLLFTFGIPFVNLVLFFFQPFELISGLNKTNQNVENFGRADNFTYFYVVMGCYSLIIICFFVYSHCFSNWRERLKLYLLVDNILICQLATAIAYAAVHILSFASVYNTDDEGLLVQQIIVVWQDVIVIILYILTNFAFAGIFRVLMVNVLWKPCQLLLYKLAITLSSLLYIVLGLIYLFGKDSLSNAVQFFNNQITDQLYYAYQDPPDFEYVMFLNQLLQVVKDSASTLSNFMILYVFNNFAFSFEIVAKLTDFDGTSDLKTTYEIVETQ